MNENVEQVPNKNELVVLAHCVMMWLPFTEQITVVAEESYHIVTAGCYFVYFVPDHSQIRDPKKSAPPNGRKVSNQILVVYLLRRYLVCSR